MSIPDRGLYGSSGFQDMVGKQYPQGCSSSDYGVHESRKKKRTRKCRRKHRPLIDLCDYESFIALPAKKALRFTLSHSANFQVSQGISIEGACPRRTAAPASVQGMVIEDTSSHRRNGPSPVQESEGPVFREPVDVPLQLISNFADRMVMCSRLADCRTELMQSKLKIMDARVSFGLDVWNMAGRIVNPYEVLSCIGIQVLNRAFFKMWELMHTCPGLMSSIEHEPALLSAHLCEGPGAFLQAVLMRRLWYAVEAKGSLKASQCEVSRSHPPHYEATSKWFAITLATPHNNDNALKLQTDKLLSFEQAKGHVHYGADQSGDVTKPDNISSFVDFVLQQCSGKKMHLVTGDGAFDVSDDFSLQEQRHSHLAFSELVIAVRLQAHGGCLVLKLFDCFTETSAYMLWVLTILYSKVEVVRLRTSRVCNSERFVVAQGFHGLPPSLERRLMDISIGWHEAVQKGSLAALDLTDPLPAKFLEALITSNVAIASNQSLSISNAVDVAQHLGERLSTIRSTLKQKEILSVLRRKLRTVPKLKINACSLCESLGIPFAGS